MTAQENQVSEVRLQEERAEAAEGGRNSENETPSASVLSNTVFLDARSTVESVPLSLPSNPSSGQFQDATSVSGSFTQFQEAASATAPAGGTVSPGSPEPRVGPALSAGPGSLRSPGVPNPPVSPVITPERGATPQGALSTPMPATAVPTGRQRRGSRSRSSSRSRSRPRARGPPQPQERLGASRSPPSLRVVRREASPEDVAQVLARHFGDVDEASLCDAVRAELAGGQELGDSRRVLCPDTEIMCSAARELVQIHGVSGLTEWLSEEVPFGRDRAEVLEKQLRFLGSSIPIGRDMPRSFELLAILMCGGVLTQGGLVDVATVLALATEETRDVAAAEAGCRGMKLEHIAGYCIVRL